jgi:hypothetical protein
MVAANASMDVAEHLLPLLATHALLQDPYHALLLEGVTDHDVHLGTAREASHPYVIGKEGPSNEVAQNSHDLFQLDRRNLSTLAGLGGSFSVPLARVGPFSSLRGHIRRGGHYVVRRALASRGVGWPVALDRWLVGSVHDDSQWGQLPT